MIRDSLAHCQRCDAMPWAGGWAGWPAAGGWRMSPGRDSLSVRECLRHTISLASRHTYVSVWNPVLHTTGRMEVDIWMVMDLRCDRWWACHMFGDSCVYVCRHVDTYLLTHTYTHRYLHTRPLSDRASRSTSPPSSTLPWRPPHRLIPLAHVLTVLFPLAWRRR